MTNSKIEIEVVPSLDNELTLNDSHNHQSLALEFSPIVESQNGLETASEFSQPSESSEQTQSSAAHSPLPSTLCDELLLTEISSIPSKMAFKIGDVADLLGIKQYVLRYWETEFDILRPKKASNNQRMYTRKDVENALLIRKLLHRDRFSIEGAKNAMKDLKVQVKKEKNLSQVIHRIENLNEGVDSLLMDIRAMKNLFAAN